MFADLTIKDFLKKVGSKAPVPGGGSAAALSAAVAASLSEMVANLTIGRKGFEEVEPEMKQIARVAAEYREKLVKDIDRDSQAYAEVMAAYQLPKNTDKDKDQRDRAIQKGLKNATLVPFSVAEDALKIMDLSGIVVKKGNKNAISDGAVAAMCARTAVLAALYNVKINLSSLKDHAFVEKVVQKVKRIEDKVESIEKEILTNVDL
jgi:formiminotetrahydrofolate cyclodeaminase